MVRYVSVAALFLIIAFSGHGQIGNLGKKLKEKAKEVLKETLAEEADKKRDSYDTTSFNFAIAFLDKSESFADREKGERLVKAADFLISRQEEKTDLEQARDLFEAGNLSYINRQYVIGEAYLLAAIASFAGINELSNPVYLKTLGTIGLLYSDMGRFGLAEEFTSRALDGWEESMGKESAGYAAEYNNLAVLNMNLAEFNTAENQLKDALKLIQSTEGSNSVPYAIGLNNLGILHQYMGRSEEALEEINKSLEIGDEKLRDKSSTFLQLLTNKALILQETGQYDLAEKTYDKAIDLQVSRFKINKTSDPDYAHMLNNLASLYVVTDRLSEAEKLLRESLAIYENKFGDDHVTTAAAREDLGNLLRVRGNFEGAAPLITSAFDVRSSALGPSHPATVKNMESLAIVNWKTGNNEEARQQFDEVMTYTMNFIDEFFPPMSEAEKTKYWEKMKPRFYTYFNFAFDQFSTFPELLDNAINYRLATKGLLLSTTTRIKNIILSSGDDGLIGLYEQWQDQKNLLATYYSMSREDITEQGVNIDSLEDAANMTERQLSLNSADFAATLVSGTTDYRSIQGLLSESEAVVEMIHMPEFETRLTDEITYIAVIIGNTGVPAVVQIPDGNLLDTRYFAYYNNVIRQRISDEFSYLKFWADIDEKLRDKPVVYFSADGVYSQVNLNTFRKPDGTFIIQEKDIRYIGNPLDLTNEGASGENKQAFLLGFPDYGTPTIPPLPGTQEEITRIASSLRSTYTVETRLQKDASEESIKRIQSPGIVHIATHGFFLEDVTEKGNVFGVSVEYARNNPLLRSGIMLAGASDEEDVNSFKSNNDGILTAYEAMNLKLNATDLVVLSACETGKGDIRAGEGVYGLQRAFQVAGTQSLLMSLWKVDDQATQQLMTTFYQNWSRSPTEPINAFRKAQLTLMETYSDPYYWGAFVMIGR